MTILGPDGKPVEIPVPDPDKKIKWMCWEERGFPVTDVETNEPILDLDGLKIGQKIWVIGAWSGEVVAEVTGVRVTQPADNMGRGSAEAVSGLMLKSLVWDGPKRGWVCIGMGNINAIKKLVLELG